MSAARGKRVVVTRSADRARTLCDALVAIGAVPVPFPTIETLPPRSTEQLDHAIRSATGYDWIVFTSATGVNSAFDRADAIGAGAGWAGDVPVGVVGPATAAALDARGRPAAVMPETFTGSSMATALGDVRGRRFLLLRADRARPDLPAALRKAGGIVADVCAYRTQPLSAVVDGPEADDLRRGFDAITFTSPSTVEGFVNGAGADWRTLVDGAIVAAIGPVTGDAARAAGLRVRVEAEPHTIDGLVGALVRAFEQQAVERP